MMQGCFVTSLFFWGWAIYNTMTMVQGFDLGCGTFLMVVFTSGYHLTDRGKTPTKKSRILVLLSHLLVSANYALGILFAMTAGVKPYYHFGIYCLIFMLLWLWVACYSWNIIGKVMNSSQEERGDFDDLYSFSGSGVRRNQTYPLMANSY